MSVVVIEAGGFYELDDGNVSTIPAFYAKNFNQTPVADTIQPLIDWAYITEPQVVSNMEPCPINTEPCRVWQIDSSITLRAKPLVEGMKTWRQLIKRSVSNSRQYWPQLQHLHSVSYLALHRAHR